MLHAAPFAQRVVPGSTASGASSASGGVFDWIMEYLEP